jgi:hypothetical protein
MSVRLIAFTSAATFLAAFAFMPATASAGPSGLIGIAPDVSLIQPVKYEKRRARRDTHVRAPFTSVDTTKKRTDVDAPFTSVRTGRKGTWVRAPFVDLFVPRN